MYDTAVYVIDTVNLYLGREIRSIILKEISAIIFG